jgi:hypothetical protein
MLVGPLLVAPQHNGIPALPLDVKARPTCTIELPGLLRFQGLDSKAGMPCVVVGAPGAAANVRPDAPTFQEPSPFFAIEVGDDDARDRAGDDRPGRRRTGRPDGQLPVRRPALLEGLPDGLLTALSGAIDPLEGTRANKEARVWPFVEADRNHAEAGCQLLDGRWAHFDTSTVITACSPIAASRGAAKSQSSRGRGPGSSEGVRHSWQALRVLTGDNSSEIEMR